MSIKRHSSMDMKMSSGLPWLEYPLSYHSSREHTCSFNNTAICDWNFGYWRNWYMDDLRYALPTVAFFINVILLFMFGSLFDSILPQRFSQGQSIRRLIGAIRFLSYRAFRISTLNWNSAPVGVLALGALGAVYFFSMTLGPKPYYWPNTRTVNYGDSPAIATRSGWLSIACMPFVFATAGKSNFIKMVTGISHEKLQVFHRWISYAFLVTALVHTFPFIVYHIKMGDMAMQWKTSSFYWTGVAALVPQCYLTFASFSPLRDYFVVTGVLFSLSWLHRQIRIYFEHGIGHKARLNLDSNGFIHVTIPTKATWGVGQHFFIRFLSLGLHAWTVHPFTACSLPRRASFYDSNTSELVFYIRPQKGFTGRLARYVAANPNCAMAVLLDGPYGGINMRKIEQSHRQVVIAGGSGAGWIMPMIIAYLRKLEVVHIDDTKMQPSLRVILAIRDASTRAWFEEKVQELLRLAGMNASPPGLNLELYFTGLENNPDTAGQFLLEPSESGKEYHTKNFAVDSQSGSVNSPGSASSKSLNLQYHEIRPHLPTIIREEAKSTEPNKPLGIFVCGPLSMQNDIANAVAEAQIGIMKTGLKDVYLHMEHFSWA